jgi:hypothetical protein
VAFAILLSGLGCRKSNHKKLVGTWVIDAEATMRSLTDSTALSEMSDAQRKTMIPAFEKMLGAMSVTFTKETLSLSAPGAPEIAYEVKSSKGDIIVISAKAKEGDLRIEFTSANTMKFSPAAAGLGGPAADVAVYWKRKK